MQEAIIPVAVRFPLAGEWCPVNTPGYKVPSHGTDQLGQRYAYDFFQIDWSRSKGYKFYKTPFFRSLIFGVDLSETYCWSQPIYAPFDGVVVEARDGLAERNPVHVVRDLFIVLKNSLLFRADSNSDLHTVLGNYIILKKQESVYALIAHARQGSINVVEGQKVSVGQKLAEVGHSGNSSAPHLHFQLMDSPKLLEAEGLPCCFFNYQSFQQGEWFTIHNGIPGRRERIRA